MRHPNTRDRLLAAATAGVMFMTIAATGSAVAQDSGGVRVGGDVTINATADDISNRASNGSTAEVGIGRVADGAKVGGDVRINANAEDISNRADNRSKACVEVGSVGKNACR